MALELKTPSDIDVVMATYNGASYIRQQIDSILAQECRSLRLIIRDDGSTDATVDILASYAREYPGIIQLLPPDKNLGVKMNFSRLLEHTSADYVFFSDQDDVWDNDKIAKSLEKMNELERMHGKGTPLLVHTDLKVVDHDLSLISPSFWSYAALDPFNGKTLNRLLMQNVVTGCAAMVNRPLLERALPIPEYCVMHDWWVALVAASFGAVEPLPKSTIAYRQHGNNTLGASRYMTPSYVIKGLKRSSECATAKRAQAKELVERYQAVLSADQKEMIEAFISLPGLPLIKRAYLMYAHGLFKSGVARNIWSLLKG